MRFFLTGVVTIYPVKIGLTIPATVAKLLQIPIKTPANCGAMSK